MSGFENIISRPPFAKNGLTLSPAWISYRFHHEVSDEITYPFTNFDGATVEVWKWTRASDYLNMMWLKLIQKGHMEAMVCFALLFKWHVKKINVSVTLLNVCVCFWLFDIAFNGTVHFVFFYFRFPYTLSWLFLITMIIHLLNRN